MVQGADVQAVGPSKAQPKAASPKPCLPPPPSPQPLSLYFGGDTACLAVSTGLLLPWARCPAQGLPTAAAEQYYLYLGVAAKHLINSKGLCTAEALRASTAGWRGAGPGGEAGARQEGWAVAWRWSKRTLLLWSCPS